MKITENNDWEVIMKRKVLRIKDGGVEYEVVISETNETWEVVNVERVDGKEVSEEDLARIEEWLVENIDEWW